MNNISTISGGIRNDLFESIEFKKGVDKKMNHVLGMKIGRHFVPKWIFQETWKHVCTGIAVADKYKLHSTEDLFNNEKVWKSHSDGIHRIIGVCLSYFVANNMLPLTCANPHQTNKLYVLIDPSRQHEPSPTREPVLPPAVFSGCANTALIGCPAALQVVPTWPALVVSATASLPPHLPSGLTHWSPLLTPKP